MNNCNNFNDLILHFVNVGKGNCTIIDFPSGRLSVVDIDDSRAGEDGESNTTFSLAQILGKSKDKNIGLTNPIDYIIKNFPDRKIFRFILTHPDMDHMSGIKALFEKIQVLNFWHVPVEKPDPGNWENSPYNEKDWEFYQSLKNFQIEDVVVISPLRNYVANCCWVQDGIKILSPTEALIENAQRYGEYDEASYVLQINYNGIKIMLTGDATKRALDDIAKNYSKGELKSSILLAPGHGSKNHVSTDFLDAVKPKLTIISIAEGVEYDYYAYKKYGLVLSTKHYGNIKVKVKYSGRIFFITQFNDYSKSWNNLSWLIYYTKRGYGL